MNFRRNISCFQKSLKNSCGFEDRKVLRVVICETMIQASYHAVKLNKTERFLLNYPNI